MQEYQRAAINKFGTEINFAASAEEAVRLGGLDWQVEKRQLLTPQGTPIPNQCGVFRTDKENDIEGYLGAVKQKYTPIQNRDAFQFLDSVLEADESRKAHYEMAGYTGRGERTFALINLDKSFDIVPGDRHDSFLCATNSHDGSSKSGAFVIVLRGVCANTIPARLASAGVGSKTVEARFSFTHTKNVQARMQEAAHLLRGAWGSVERVKEKLKELSTRQLSRKHVDIVRDLLLPKAPESASDRSKSIAENRRAKFLELFESNDSGEFRLIKDTAYNAYNAFTEYVDHEVNVVRSSVKQNWTTEEIRAERALFGTGAEQKERALEIILRATNDAPRFDPLRVYSTANTQPISLLDSILMNASLN